MALGRDCCWALVGTVRLPSSSVCWCPTVGWGRGAPASRPSRGTHRPLGTKTQSWRAAGVNLGALAVGNREPSREGGI